MKYRIKSQYNACDCHFKPPEPQILIESNNYEEVKEYYDNYEGNFVDLYLQKYCSYEWYNNKEKELDILYHWETIGRKKFIIGEYVPVD